MKKTLSLLPCILLLFFSAPAFSQSKGPDVSSLDQNDPMTWLVKSVCVNSKGQLLPVDPYGGCPAGTTIRKMQVGDPLPYYNKDNFNQCCNNFPVQAANGQVYVVSGRNFAPYPEHEFHYGPKADGYDVYGVNFNNDGWMSQTCTRDGGGYGTTTFGAHCEIGGGWVFFPVANFLKGGISEHTSVDACYYMQNGESYPGPCPEKYHTDFTTTWQLVKGYRFGGIGGGPVKPMDAMMCVHGYVPASSAHRAAWAEKGHIEVFYFTREYGLTRWEDWKLASQNPKKAPVGKAGASLPDTVNYQGDTFVITDVRDNSDTQPATRPMVPIFPIPDVNLLAHANFDDSFAESWLGTGKSAQGNPFTMQVLNSTWHSATSIYGDMRHGTGTHNLQIKCGSPSDTCTPWNEYVYQDLPARNFKSGPYAFAIGVHTDAGTGTIGVAVQQLDGSNKVLATYSATATVNSVNGAEASQVGSAYYSNVFVHKNFVLNLDPSATHVRFLVSPQTPQAFDILEAWFAPWPLPASSSFAATASNTRSPANPANEISINP